MEDNIIKDIRNRFKPKREKNEIDHTAIKGKRNLFKLKKKMKQLIQNYQRYQLLNTKKNTFVIQ